jgi:hypothetical protein
VGLYEDAVHPGCDRGARQRADELRLPARDVARAAGQLDAVGGIENHRPTGVPHNLEPPHVHDEVVVTKG